MAELTVPRVDFSSLGDLPQTYRANQMDATRRATLAQLGQGASPADVAQALFQAGDLQGGLSLANLANTQQQQRQAQSNSDRSFGLQQQAFNRREEPEDVRKLKAAGIDPNSPEGRKALFPRTDTPISAVDKREVFKAEDELPGLTGTVENLNRALELNDKTFSGMGAGMRATVGANLPDGIVPDFIADKKGAVATSEWQKIMGPEALTQMAATLKGATTDFELRKFIEMLGDPATDPKIRAGIINRMKTLAQRKLELSERRVRDLRGGNYFKPGQSGGTSAQGGALEAAKAAIAKGADPAAVRQRLQENGIDPSGL